MSSELPDDHSGTQHQRSPLPRSNGGSGDQEAPDTSCEVSDPPHHAHNFRLAVLYMVFMRTGWIFKTESIVMPAVLDVIGGAGWLRGCLPMLNRLGQSLPPMLASDRVRGARLKKLGLFSTTSTMGACFLLLAAIWAMTEGAKSWWLPIVFLVIYAVFFAATGINMMVLNTISGKLIRVDRRGRLSLVGTVLGATIAVCCGWYFLNLWLVDESVADGTRSNFEMIFFFTGMTFVAAAFIGLFFKEAPDENHTQRRGGKDLLLAAYETFKTDRNFRRLAIIAALFGMYLTLFPHYQRLGRDRLDLGLSALIPWLLAQNIGAALFSIPTGWIADRFGNRLVIQLILLVLCIAPALALFLSWSDDVRPAWFIVVFGLLGLTPVAMRFLNNYTLEIASHGEHPHYLSTLAFAIAAPPILLSPLIGALIDWVGFELIFAIVIGCVFSGWLMAFTLVEPRKLSSGAK
jgi:MFS family permease